MSNFVLTIPFNLPNLCKRLSWNCFNVDLNKYFFDIDLKTSTKVLQINFFYYNNILNN
jgi:hypothetical protein